MRAVFVDANILLDLLDSGRKRHFLAKETLGKILTNGDKIAISEDMISNIYYIAKKAKVDELKLLEFLEFWIKYADVLPFGKELISEAIAYCKQNPNNDLEDVLQAFCAIKNSCDCVLTEDKAFPKEIITTVSLSSYLF